MRVACDIREAHGQAHGKLLLIDQFTSNAASPAAIHRDTLAQQHAALAQGAVPSSPRQPSSYAVQYACRSCHDCNSVRINLETPLRSKSMHRMIVNDMFATGMALNPHPDRDEHFALFSRHYEARQGKWLRHVPNDTLNYGHFAQDLDGCAVFEFRDGASKALVGATLVDLMPPFHSAGKPSAYGQFNYYVPDDASPGNRASPGIIQFGRVAAWLEQQGFEHFYLGRWTPGPFHLQL